MKKAGGNRIRRGAGTLLPALALCFAWAALSASAGASGGPSDVSPPGEIPADAACLRILFTAETRGNLEPCRCPDRPLGGLARRAAFLASAPDRAAANGASDGSGLESEGAQARSGLPGGGTPVLLRLDLGGFLPEGQVPLADRPGVAERYVSLLLEGLLASGIDLGVLDHGMERFLRQTAPDQFDSLAPRLLQADPPGPPSTIPWGGRRIALLALEEQLSDEVIREAAARAWDAAGPDGYLFVLGRADGLSGRRLARLTRADLVLLSRGARFPRPLAEGRSLLLACGAQGKEVGDLLVRQARPGPPEAPGASPSGPDQAAQPQIPTGLPFQAPGGRLAILSWALQPMDASSPEDPGLARKVQALLEEAGPGYRAVLEPAE